MRNDLFCSMKWCGKQYIHTFNSTADLNLMYSLSPVSKDISFMLISLSEKLTQNVGNLEEKFNTLKTKYVYFYQYRLCVQVQYVKFMGTLWSSLNYLHTMNLIT